MTGRSTEQPVPLLLMADYWADPLWRRRPGGHDAGMVPLDSLPLSDELRARLREWAARYDALMQTDHEWPSDEERVAWVRRGRELLTAVRAELGPGYDITYFEGRG